MKAQKIIDEYQSSEGVKEEFGSIYMYALYVCGGDFSLFDDLPLLTLNIDLEHKDKI